MCFNGNCINIYPGIPKTPKDKERGSPSGSGISHAPGNPFERSLPLFMVWERQPNSPTTCFPTGYFGFLLSIILDKYKSNEVIYRVRSILKKILCAIHSRIELKCLVVILEIYEYIILMGRKL